MGGVVARTRMGPETFEVNVAVTGGQLVMPDAATGKIKPTDSTNVANWLGVALYDAQPAGTTGGGTVYGAFPNIAADVPQSEVAVAWHGTVKIVAAEALNWGDVVYAGTLGRVQKAVTTGRAVGQVMNTGGVANGAQALVRLF